MQMIYRNKAHNGSFHSKWIYVTRYSKRYLKLAPTCVWFLETNQLLKLEEGNKLAQLWSLSLLAKFFKNSYTQ